MPSDDWADALDDMCAEFALRVVDYAKVTDELAGDSRTTKAGRRGRVWYLRGMLGAYAFMARDANHVAGWESAEKSLGIDTGAMLAKIG